MAAEPGASSPVKSQPRKLPKSITAGWRQTGLDSGILLAVARQGYRAPTAIQRAAIPALMDGRDVVAMARTGSGKTAAFLLPLLHKLRGRDASGSGNSGGARALVVSPTRELALQTFRCVKQLGKHTGLRAAVMVGGDSLEDQFTAVHNRPDIIVATPGRLMHLVVEMDLSLSTVQMVVFDEADRLFELGFAEQLHSVLKRLPEHKQVALFSATLPKMLADFASSGLKEPMLIRKDTVRIVPEQLEVAFLYSRSEEKIAAYAYLLRKVLKPDSGEQTIVFCATKHFVEYLTMVTSCLGVACTYLYSSLDPAARHSHMARFAARQCNVLIVTDVAARGVDLPMLDTVVNFHFPPRPKLFVHRVGRAARAGRRGRAISLLSADELPYLLDLALFLGRPLDLAPADGKHSGGGEDEGAPADRCVLGRLQPDALSDALDMAAPALHSAGDSAELQGLRATAANSMLRYARTRPQAAGESVRRAKEWLANCVDCAGAHPMLRAATAESDGGGAAPELRQQRNTLLQSIRKYKPAATIFEVGAGNKAAAAATAKATRRAHDKQRTKIVLARIAQDTMIEQPATSSAPRRSAAQSVSKKKPPVSRKQDAFYVQYAPKDMQTEKGLSVEKSSFARAASAAVVDFTADDDEETQSRAKGAKKWDRKKKKYVGPAESANAKTVRLEDGSRVPASLRQGRYDRWKRRHRIDVDAGALPPNAESVGWGHRDARTRKRARYAGNESAPAPAAASKKRVRLKPKEQILKERRRKAAVQDYQKYREKKRGKHGKK